MKSLSPGARRWIRRFVPGIVGGGLILYIAMSTPWGEVGDALEDLNPLTWLWLLLLSLAYYLLKAVRFWYMLGPIGVPQPLRKVLPSYIAAQPVSLLPGGELYRNKMLQDRTGVPMAASSPTFTMQGLVEGLAITALTITAAVLARFALSALIVLGVLLVLAVIYLSSGRIATPQFQRNINRLPFITVSRKRLIAFSHSHQQLLKPVAFSIIMAMTLASELAGIAIVHLAVSGLGQNISWSGATIAYGLPILVAFISFLPGGIGAADQTSISILKANGLSDAVSVAATILVRFYIVVLGVIIGGATWGALRIRDRRQAA